jgi:predicted PurR-regulated permease PerM
VPCSRKLRLLILFALVAALIAVALWWGGTILVEQAHDFLSAMQGLVKRAGKFAESGGFGLPANSVDLTHFIPTSGVLFGGVRTVASTIFGVIALAAAILFLGAFFAWSPEIYKAVVLGLLPRDKRERVSEVMDLAGHAMGEWLIGQSISMLAIFLFSLAALFLVRLPYPLLLAVQAGRPSSPR